MAKRRLRYVGKYLRPLMAAALILGMLAGCTVQSENPDDGQTSGDGTSTGRPLATSYAADNVFSVNFDPDYSLNPLTTKSEINLMFGTLIYETLVEVDENFYVHPNLATSYTSEDGKAWVIYVDNSIVFHDGSTLTAADAAYSLQRAMHTDYQGAKLSNVMGVTALDESALLINLYYPDRLFPALLNVPVIKYGTINDEVPVGSGPYELDLEEMKLVLFEDYRNADKMPINIIYLKAYPKAEDKIAAFEDALIDIIVNDPTGLSNLGYGSANEIRYVDTTSMHYLGFNMESFFFQYNNFRRAVNFAVDKEYIVDELMEGSGLVSALPVSPKSSLYNEEFNEKYWFDTETCLAAFKAAGIDDYDDDGKLEYMLTGIPMEIDINFIVNSENTVKLMAARQIAEALRGIGIPVNLRELPWTDFATALEEGDYDMYYGEIKLTPDFDLTCLLTEDGSLNYGKVKDIEYANRIAAYLTASDEDRQMYADLMYEYITDTSPIIALCFETREVLTHRGVVSNMLPTQYDVFNNLEDWTINLD